MDIDIIFKIAGIGIVTAMINMILKKSDKDEIAQVVTIAAIVICLIMIIDMIGGLFDSIRSIFRLY